MHLAVWEKESAIATVSIDWMSYLFTEKDGSPVALIPGPGPFSNLPGRNKPSRQE